MYNIVLGKDGHILNIYYSKRCRHFATNHPYTYNNISEREGITSSTPHLPDPPCDTFIRPQHSPLEGRQGVNYGHQGDK